MTAHCFQLRDYQRQIVDEARSSFRARTRAVLIHLATGGGKTVLGSFMVDGSSKRGLICWWLVHRRELASQASKTFYEMGIDHGMIAGGRSTDIGQRVQIGSIQTVARRLDDLPAPDLIVFDEAHHLGAAQWQQVYDRFPDAIKVGLTATPWRLDGKGLGNWFETMIQGPSVGELIDQGSLSTYRLFAPSTPDVSAVKSAMGDFKNRDLAAVMDKPAITGDAVSHYLQLARGKRAVAFAVSIEHSRHVVAQFIAAGIPAAHVDGKMHHATRDAIVASFVAGDILLLSNCDLLGEGFDVPAIEAAILLRPTQSLSLHLQQMGRALRPFPGKDCLASGTRLLTRRGLVPIEQIKLNDLLWDGIDWVRHGGVISKGFRNVVTYQGLTATPDHKVWTAEGWRTFGQCAREQIPVVQTGLGRTALWHRDDHLPRSSMGREGVEQEGPRPHPLQRLRRRTLDFARQLAARADEGLQTLQSAGALPQVALHANAGSRAALLEPQPRCLGGLRRARNHFRFRLAIGRGALGAGSSGSSGKPEDRGDRSHRQRQGLRAGQPSLVVAAAKSVSHASVAEYRADAQIQTSTSRDQLCGFDAHPNAWAGNDGRADRGAISQAVGETKRQVWDILDAGPRNRFTAEGLLVHNCAIILDHAGNCARHGLPDDDREWSLDDREKRRKGAKAEVMVRTCTKCFRVYRPAPTCPGCGHALVGAPREIEQRDGQLVEVDRSELVARRKGLMRSASSLEDMKRIAAELGYKPGWAFHAWQNSRRNPANDRRVA